MASKMQRQQAVKEVVDQVAAQVAEKLDNVVNVDEREAERAAKLRLKNRDGGMLLCNLTLQKVEGKPDPQVITIGEEIRWIKRGKPVIVPWYVVQMLKDNIEVRYRPDKDEAGRRITIREEVPSEAFSYSPINPAEGVTI